MQQHYQRLRSTQPLSHPPRAPSNTLHSQQDSSLAPSPSDVFQHQNPQVTLRYLKQYLNQVIVENCQLRSLLDQRNNQLAAMQNTVNEKNRDLELLKRAKEEIERTIERVAQINTNHLRDIERKNRDIQDLQSRMNSIQGNQPAIQREYAKLLVKYNKLETKYTALKEKVQGFGDQSLGTSTFSTNSVLDQVKSYVKEIQQRANLRVGTHSVKPI